MKTGVVHDMQSINTSFSAKLLELKGSSELYPKGALEAHEGFRLLTLIAPTNFIDIPYKTTPVSYYIPLIDEGSAPRVAEGTPLITVHLESGATIYLLYRRVVSPSGSLSHRFYLSAEGTSKQVTITEIAKSILGKPRVTKRITGYTLTDFLREFN